MLKVDFCDAIRAAIPSLFELLKSQDIGVPYFTTSVLDKLATNSE
jgi:hypothetical protein